MNDDHRFTLATIDAAFRHFALIADGLRDVDVERALAATIREKPDTVSIEMRRILSYNEMKHRIAVLFPEGWSQPKRKD